MNPIVVELENLLKDVEAVYQKVVTNNVQILTILDAVKNDVVTLESTSADLVAQLKTLVTLL